MINIFLDTETTGLSNSKNALWQVAGLIYKDEELLESFDIKCAPLPKDKINSYALKMSGMNEQEIRSLQSSGIALKKFKKILKKYINPYDKSDKAHMYGYNVSFDSGFIRSWFYKNNDKYYGSWFWTPPIDVMVIAGKALKDVRPSMKNFKLGTVAKTLDVRVSEEELHDALYDVMITREVYFKSLKLINDA